MTLSELITEAKSWSSKEQAELCRLISQNITIAIRSILSDGETSEKEKLEAIRWVNEFHHRINNLKFDIENGNGEKDNMDLLGKQATFYAKQDEITKNEIASVLKFAQSSLELKSKKDK